MVANYAQKFNEQYCIQINNSLEPQCRKEGQKFLELCLLVLIISILSLTPVLLYGPMKTQIFARLELELTSFFFCSLENETYGDKVICSQSLYQILTELRSMEVLLRRRRLANTFYSIIDMGHLGFIFSSQR